MIDHQTLNNLLRIVMSTDTLHEIATEMNNKHTQLIFAELDIIKNKVKSIIEFHEEVDDNIDPDPTWK